MNKTADIESGRDTLLTHGVMTKNPEDLLRGRGLRATWAVTREAVLRLWSDDAFGLAGNVAFRMLLAVFPFLIFTSSLTAFIGDNSMAEDLIEFLIAIVPPPLVEPIVSEVERVMTVQRGGVLSIGILLTVWFAVGGVDGIRVGINRAYGIRETRSALVLNLLQAGIVLFASLMLTLIGYMLVLAPRAGSWLHDLLPSFDPASVTMGFIRLPTAWVCLVAGLFAAHVLLPARRTSFRNIWPGVLFTAVAWICLAAGFSYYLRQFADYASYYAGLAGIVAAIYFIYLGALVMIFGGELNRAIRIRRIARAMGADDTDERRHKAG